MLTLSAGLARRRRRHDVGLLLLTAALASAAACDVKDDGLHGGVIVGIGDGSTASSDARTDGRATGPSIDPVPTDAPTARPDGGPERDAAPRDAAAPIDATAAPIDARPVDTAAPPPPDTAAPPPPPDAPPPTPQVLLLIGAPTPSEGDRALAARLTALGFKVETKEVVNEAQTTEARAMAPGHALVVLSASLPQGSGLPAQLRSLAVPILCNKPVFADNLGIGRPGLSAVASAEQELQIRTPDHPMAAGRRGYVVVVNQRRPFGLVLVVPAAVIIATIAEEPEEAVIFGLEKGAADRFGPAPARRVGFFGQEQTFLSLNEAGTALFDAAVRWAVGR